MQIYKFNSILKPVLWGGDRLTAFKGLPPRDEPIGESWELSAMPNRESVVANGDDRGLSLTQLVQRYGAQLVGEAVYRRYGKQFPLLIKLIDARRDLSVQVHPDNKVAHRRHGCAGKNEMWYVLQAQEGAVIRTGFNRQMSPEELDRRLADGTILDVINATPSRTGDVFYIPAGQIHTIGAGNLLVEIQQSSDITYRVWDYNRRDDQGQLRPLHVQEAREALHYAARNGKVTNTPRMGPAMTLLADTPEFVVSRLEVDSRVGLGMLPGLSFLAVVCIAGEMMLQAPDMAAVSLRQGETALVPAAAPRVELVGNGCVLLVTVP